MLETNRFKRCCHPEIPAQCHKTLPTTLWTSQWHTLTQENPTRAVDLLSSSHCSHGFQLGNTAFHVYHSSQWTPQRTNPKENSRWLLRSLLIGIWHPRNRLDILKRRLSTGAGWLWESTLWDILALADPMAAALLSASGHTDRAVLVASPRASGSGHPSMAQFPNSTPTRVPPAYRFSIFTFMLHSTSTAACTTSNH